MLTVISEFMSETRGTVRVVVVCEFDIMLQEVLLEIDSARV